VAVALVPGTCVRAFRRLSNKLAIYNQMVPRTRSSRSLQWP